LFGTEKFRVVDGGAAGTLFEPFSNLSETCTIYTFEVRGKDAIEQTGNLNVDAGLWSHRERKTLHVARGPKASSIYPPNLELLKRFPGRFGVATRETVKLREVCLTSIDAEVADGVILPPHFIKLDIHSAEYEALIGAKDSIGNCLGLLVETWHTPVHKGQHLNSEIETLLTDWGFSLYDCHDAASWRHEVDGKSEGTDRRQRVGSESLFLREDVPDKLKEWQIALFELFGYSMRAIQLCDEVIGSGAQKGGLERPQLMRETLYENQKMRRHAAQTAAGPGDKAPTTG
jgi:hypothetical protein